MQKTLPLLSLLAAAACGGDDLVLPAEGVPAEIAVIQGNNQSGRVGAQLAEPVVIEVTDSRDRPIAGADVAFEFDGGPGSDIAPEAAVTDADGRASAQIVLGTRVGAARGEARVASDDEDSELTTEFTVVALPADDDDDDDGDGDGDGVSTALAIRTQPPATATIDVPFDRQPVIQLRDASGNDVRTSGVAVTAAVASGGGTLAGTTTRATDSDGRATFTDLRITGATSQHTLIFAASGHTSVTSAPIDVREPPNAAPSAANDAYTTTEGFETALTVAAPGVLANDTDPDGGQLRAVNASDPPHGTATLNADGSLTYSPDPDYYGEDSFTYQASDGTATSNTATVTITVQPVNDEPQFTIRGGNQTAPATPQQQRVEGFAEIISLGPNEDDQTGEFLVEVQPGGATLFTQAPAISPDGTLTYTPSGITGTVEVTVRLRDNGGTENGGDDTSDPQTFTITLH